MQLTRYLIGLCLYLIEPALRATLSSNITIRGLDDAEKLAVVHRGGQKLGLSGALRAERHRKLLGTSYAYILQPGESGRDKQGRRCAICSSGPFSIFCSETNESPWSSCSSTFDARRFTWASRCGRSTGGCTLAI